MEQEKTTQNGEEKAPPKPPRAPKGTGVPALTFPEFVQVISGIGGRDVRSGTLVLLSNVLGNSAKSSTFTNKVIALKNFSSIAVNGDDFELTSIGNGIAYPKNQDEKTLSIQKAFAAHTILGKVWNDLKGRDFEEQFLPNIMVSVGGVPDNLKGEWATYFAEAIRTAKLVKNTGGKEIVLSDFIKPGHSKSEEPTHASTKNEPPPPVQSNAEVLEKLSSSLTGGMKLNAKAGDCYVLVYIDGALTEEEAAKITTIFEAGTLLIKSRIVKG